MLWWFAAACVFAGIPVLLAFVGDEPPDNAVVHEQDGGPGTPAEMRRAA